jgi:microcystin-dependent protein
MILAETGGTEEVTLTVQQIPIHGHAPLCGTAAGTLSSPLNAYWAPASTGNQMYSSPPSTFPMHPQSIQPTGGSQPHTNFAPYLCLNFIISLFGIFPSQT